MANTVIALKKSATPSAAPTNLANGELAINYADGKLFYKAANGTISSISGNEPNYFGTVNANNTLVIADTPGDIFTIAAGKNIDIVGDAVNDKLTVSLTNDVTVPGLLSVTAASGDEGGEIRLANAITNSLLSGPVNIDIFRNQLRFFVAGGDARGAFINLAATSAGVGTDLLAAATSTDAIARATASQAFDKANAALPNVSGTWFNGTLSTSADFVADKIISTNNGNGENFKVGDDAWIGDFNTTNSIRIKGQQNPADGYINFGTGDAKLLGRSGTGPLTYDGSTIWHAGNSANASQAFDKANTANITADRAWNHANAAFANGNTTIQTAQSAFTQANLAFIHANNAFASANAGQSTANAAFNRANTANITADRAWNHANAAFITANIAFANANTVMISAQAAFTVANSGFIHANSGYAFANSISITANLAFAHANAAFANGNTVIQTAQSAFTQANLAFIHANNAFASANAGQASANAAFNTANTANITADRAWNHANAAFVSANIAFANANTVMISTQAAFTVANSSFLHSNAAYAFANSITVTANLAFAHANAAFATANAAFDKANSTTYTSNVVISVADNTNAALRITQTGTGHAILVEDDANPDSTPFVVSNTGNVGIGTTDPGSPLTIKRTGLGTGSAGAIKIISVVAEGTSPLPYIDFEYYGTIDGSPTHQMRFKKAMGNSAYPTIIGANKPIGRIASQSHDGVSFYDSTLIRFTVDGTPAVNSTPGAIEFYTTRSGSTTLGESMRIASSGNVLIGRFTDSTVGSGVKLDIAGAANASNLLVNGNMVFTHANDGSGSNLDADFLDGQHGSYYGIATDVTAAFAHANAAFANANTVMISAQAAFTVANSSFLHTNAAYSFANSIAITANLAFAHANLAFANGNTVIQTAQSAFNQANLAFIHANNAFASANAGQASGNAAQSTANAAFNRANTANITADRAWNHANAAFASANIAFANANTVMVSAQAAFAVANSGFLHANSGYAFANSIAITANLAFAHANLAFANGNTTIQTAQSAFNQANLAFIHANNAFASSNAEYAFSNSAHSIANLAFTHANNAYAHANAAFLSSNGVNTYTNSTYVKLTAPSQTITGDLNLVGTLTLSGNTVFIDATRLEIDDPLIYLAGNNYTSDIVDIGFIANYVNATGQNVHTGLYREHENKEYYLFQGYDKEPANNHIGAFSNNMTLAVLNADIRTSNLILGGVNAISTIGASFNHANAAHASANAGMAIANGAFASANAGQATANAAFTRANNSLLSSSYTAADVLAKLITVDGAGTTLDADLLDGQQGSYYGIASDVTAANRVANAAFLHANAAFATANVAFANANTVMISAQAAFTVANSGFIHANSGYAFANSIAITANLAFAHANLAFANGNTVIQTAQSAFNQANLSFIHANNAYARANSSLLSSSYTAADVLAKLITVDGAGTTLDADLLDGQQGSYYGIASDVTAAFLRANNSLLSSSYTAADVLAKLLTVDGAGTNLDADLLDGQQGSYYGIAADVTAAFLRANNSLLSSSYTAADVLAKLITVDGAGTNLDADLLDGQQGSYYGIATDVTAANRVANAAFLHANAGYAFANSSHSIANLAFTHANNAYATANGRVSSVSGTGTVSGITLSGTVTTSGSLTLGGTLSASIIDNMSDEHRLFNNMGDNHATRTAFDITGPSINFGWRFVQGSTNGPGVTGTQFYSEYLGLGNEYPATGAGSYGMQIAYPRNVTEPYITIRYNEANTFTAWQKVSAGNSDKLGGQAGSYYGIASDVTAAFLRANNSLLSSSYTAADVLAKLITVDGAGTNLDADLLDGQQGSYYAIATDVTAANRVANAAFLHANAGYAFANSIAITANLAFAHANAAFANSNTDILNTQSAFNQANLSYLHANAAFASANAGQATANVALGRSNTLFITANSAWDKANVANITADRAWNHANAAFALANISLLASSYTAADVLSKLLTVDGAGTNLDADLLDGQQGSYYGIATDVSAANRVANAAFLHANADYSFSNSAHSIANLAFVHANAAFTKANTGSSGKSIIISMIFGR